MIFLFVLLPLFAGLQEGNTLLGFAVLPESRIEILGHTNVNRFNCENSTYTGADTLVLEVSQDKQTVFRQGRVKLSAKSFSCGLKVMTKDFGKTIKSDQYPFIEIEFVSFARIPRYDSEKEEFDSELKITLAGASVISDVRSSVVRDENGSVHLVGRKDFTFSQFQLSPPTRMMGTVKVQETLTVDFHLVLRRI